MAASAQSDRPACFLTSAKDPSGQKTFDASQGSDLKEYIESGMLCPTACFDTALTLTLDGTKVTAAIKATNKCGSEAPTKETADKLKRGCSAGQTHPSAKITLIGTVLNNLKQPKDRCDIQAIQQTSAGQDGVSKTFALQSQLNAALQKVDPQTEEGRQQLGKVLVNFGVDQDTADAKVADAEKATDVQKQLQALVGNDKDAAKEAADTLGLKLNADLSDQARLNPDNFKPVLSDQEYEQAKLSYATTSTGFNDPNAGVSDLDKAKNAICYTESRCRYETVCWPGTKNCSYDGAWGKYQVRGINVPNWTSQYCGQAMSPQQFREDSSCQEKVFEGEFGKYAQQCGYDGAALKWFTGRCQPNPNSSDGGLTAAQYLAKFRQQFANGTPPFGAGSSVYTGGGGSPFAQVNPLGPTGQTQVACDMGYCYATNQYASMTAAPVGVPAGAVSGTTPTTPVSTGVPVSAQNPLPPVGTPAQPVATLITQPAHVIHGNPLTISWSSVGMRTDQACRIFVTPASTSTPAQLAQANDGSKAITVQSPGDLKIDMNCLAANGQTVTRSATVTVQ